MEPMEPKDDRLVHAAWGFLILAMLYLSAHVIVAAYLGNLPPDPCGAACDDPAAAEAVQEAHRVTGLVCWADPAEDLPAGYRVTCRP